MEHLVDTHRYEYLRKLNKKFENIKIIIEPNLQSYLLGFLTKKFIVFPTIFINFTLQIQIMTDTILYTKISILPPSLKVEVMNYLDSLIKKQKSFSPKKHPKAGCTKGAFKMSVDFNEPLEDFKDYM